MPQVSSSSKAEHARTDAGLRLQARQISSAYSLHRKAYIWRIEMWVRIFKLQRCRQGISFRSARLTLGASCGDGARDTTEGRLCWQITWYTSQIFSGVLATFKNRIISLFRRRNSWWMTRGFTKTRLKMGMHDRQTSQTRGGWKFALNQPLCCCRSFACLVFGETRHTGTFWSL